jgi:hypothetical protein
MRPMYRGLQHYETGAHEYHEHPDYYKKSEHREVVDHNTIEQLDSE